MPSFLKHLIFSVIFLLTAITAPAGFAGDFSAQKANFSVSVGKTENPYRIMSFFVMPEEIVNFNISAGQTDQSMFSIRSSQGPLESVKKNQWRWHAPKKPGLYTFEISGVQKDARMQLNIFVMVPRKHQPGDYLNGYRIGTYPRILLNGLAIYQPPAGFIEVTEDNAGTLLSPHFRLKQFLCRQNGGYPKYIVLKESLLLKLELILSEVNARGYPCDTFHIMSGYRTPYYNKAIGNVKYSRHIYGGAADIFIDEHPRDNMMDDLNGDGKIDFKDAAVVYELIDRLYGKPFYQGFAGGLARYKKTENHGPFVHVDVRGRRTRWGD